MSVSETPIALPPLSAAAILARLKTVDGIGSGLDADLIQGTDLSDLVASATATTKGDLLAATAPGVIDRLGVGANGTVLTADSGETTGMKWAALGGGGGGGDMLQSTYDPNTDGIIAIANGGTNASTAATARTNLGISTVGNTGDAADLTGTLAAARIASNSLALAKLVNATGTAKIVGRYSASTGAWEELTISTGLAVDGSGNLTASGGGGGGSTAIATKTTNYTTTNADHTLLVDATSGAVTITLVAVSGNSGLIHVIKKIDSSANTVTIDGNSSETIDGATTQVLNGQWQSLEIHTDASAWYIIG